MCSLYQREPISLAYYSLGRDIGQSSKRLGGVFHCASSGQSCVFCVFSAPAWQTHINTVQDLPGNTRHPEATMNLCSSSASQFLIQALLFLSS